MAQLVMKRPQTGLKRSQTGPKPSQAVTELRAAAASDADGLARLLGAAFPEMTWDAERARKDLLDATDVAETFVVEENGQLLATASARYFDARFPGVGYVHWVAVDPTTRGRGLFDIVMAAVEDRFATDGRPVALLETDDHRLPAIGAYLRRGYVPQYTEPDHEGRWSAIFTTLAEGRRSKR